MRNADCGMRNAEFKNWDSKVRIPSRVLDSAELVLSAVEGLHPDYFAVSEAV